MEKIPEVVVDRVMSVLVNWVAVLNQIEKRKDRQKHKLVKYGA